MSAIRVEVVVSCGIPDAHSFVATCRGNAPAIRSPGNGPDPGSMAGVCIGKPARRIPYLHCHVVACRSNMLAVRRPSYSIDRIGMPGIGVYITPVEGIPDLHRPITTSRGNTFS